MYQPTSPYGRLARFALAHRRVLGVLAVVLTVVAGLIGLPPRVDSDVLSLLPRDDPAFQALHQLVEEEGGTGALTITLQSADPDALEQVADEVAEGLEALDTVRFAFHELDPELEAHLALVQLDPDDLHTLVHRLEGALALGPALNPLIAQRLLDLGPLLDRVAEARTGPGARRRVVVFSRPHRPPHDQDFAVELMGGVQRVLADVDPDGRGVEVEWIGGAYRHNVEDAAGVRHDLLLTSLVSALLVLVAISVGFRSWRAVPVVLAPLVVANAVDLAFARVALGALNTYTSFALAILIGLGIDFAVHLVGRYRELRVGGSSVDDALMAAWDRTGPPCTTAALTSAIAFLALAAADFRGFAQLGVLLAVGLVVCLGAMLVLLPPLLAALEPDPPVLLGTRAVAGGRGRGPAGIALVGALVLTALAGWWSLPRLDMERDISALRRDGLAYAELTSVEQDHAQAAYPPLVVSCPDRAALTADHRRVAQAISDGEAHWLERVASLETALPADQAARIEPLADLARLADHPSVRYLPPPLAEPLARLRGWTPRVLSRADLPEPVLEVLGAAHPDRHRLLLFPGGNMWDLDQAGQMVAEVEALLPGRPIAGEHTALVALHRTVLRDMPVIGVIALVLISALAAVDLRRPRLVAVAVLTLVAGITWAATALVLLGGRLSVVNVVGVPILLGIGIDVVIHLLHRLEEEGAVWRALRTTGVAAAISTLTTLLAFSSLMLASHRGVRSLGVVVVIGLASVFAVGVVLTPLGWLAGRREPPGSS